MGVGWIEGETPKSNALIMSDFAALIPTYEGLTRKFW